jgi:long-chain acyl-CoA synthetase
LEVKSRAQELGRHTPTGTQHLSLAAKPPTTFPALIENLVSAYGDRVFLPRRRARMVEPISFSRLTRDLERVSAGLLSLGIGHGDRVGLLADNRYDWLLADLATVCIGAVDVPRGADTATAEMLFILAHAGCRASFVEDDRTAEALLERRDSLPDLTNVISLQPETSLDDVISLTRLMECGDAWMRQHPGRLREVSAAVQPDDLLTIVYTSGTTAEPKGVMLTHYNVLSNVHGVRDVLEISTEDSLLSILPAWHMYERVMDYLALASGAQLIYTDRRSMKADLETVRPTVFAAVPRIWEIIHDGIVNHCRKLPGLKGVLMSRLLALCRTVGAGHANVFQRLLHSLCRATVLKRFKRITGGRLRLAVSGGGALPRHVDELLLGLGVPILNGYGLTETSPVAAVRLPSNNAPGTIGPPMPDTEIQARDPEGHPLSQGEVGLLWIRGPQVMKGYYNNPEKTAEVLDENGWFNSGDLGCVQPDGLVRITGRAKDTIVLSSGENVEPEPLETAIKTSPYIEQAVVIGQDQKQLGALLVPMEDCLSEAVPPAEWDERDGLLHGRAVHELFRRELDEALTGKNGFRPMERVASFRVMKEPLTTENGFLTQTLKVKRHLVHERLGHVIDELFK